MDGRVNSIDDQYILRSVHRQWVVLGFPTASQGTTTRDQSLEKHDPSTER